MQAESHCVGFESAVQDWCDGIESWLAEVQRSADGTPPATVPVTVICDLPSLFMPFAREHQEMSFPTCSPASCCVSVSDAESDEELDIDDVNLDNSTPLSVNSSESTCTLPNSEQTVVSPTLDLMKQHMIKQYADVTGINFDSVVITPTAWIDDNYSEDDAVAI
eukprot:TRINITY_DN46601_c0_g1_i1.p2 TRINITY_DN46601_c0_g1~~TRINITY_DN46601_c0_g1_i1.p2  ORF type:complete len:164 (+),score=63.18 TRINITY_DN46601_c0_g1_i1:320-811(+)